MSKTTSSPTGRDVKTRVITVLWPAFLMAGVMEMLVFALIDPDQLHGWGMDMSSWPAAAVYTVSFFLFWGIIAVASGMAVWLTQYSSATEAD